MNYLHHDKTWLAAFLYVIIIFFYKFFFMYIKISEDSSAIYYQNNKENLQERAHKRYHSLFKEEKVKKH